MREVRAAPETAGREGDRCGAGAELGGGQEGEGGSVLVLGFRVVFRRSLAPWSEFGTGTCSPVWVMKGSVI